MIVKTNKICDAKVIYFLIYLQFCFFFLNEIFPFNLKILSSKLFLLTELYYLLLCFFKLNNKDKFLIKILIQLCWNFCKTKKTLSL